MRTQSSSTTLYVRLDQAKLMLGYHGQRLGLVRKAVLDVETGGLLDLILETRWQQVDLPWQQVEFDAEEGVFRLKSVR